MVRTTNERYGLSKQQLNKFIRFNFSTFFVFSSQFVHFIQKAVRCSRAFLRLLIWKKAFWEMLKMKKNQNKLFKIILKHLSQSCIRSCTRRLASESKGRPHSKQSKWNSSSSSWGEFSRFSTEVHPGCISSGVFWNRDHKQPSIEQVIRARKRTDRRDSKTQASCVISWPICR